MVTETTAPTDFKNEERVLTSKISLIKEVKNRAIFQNIKVINVGSKITETARIPKAPTPLFKTSIEAVVAVRLSAIAPPTIGTPLTKKRVVFNAKLSLEAVTAPLIESTPKNKVVVNPIM